VYEHFHLPAPVRAKCARHLSAYSYETLEEGFDTWCLVSAEDALTRRWRRLRSGVPGVYADQQGT
jgi:hypothetical protein